MGKFLKGIGIVVIIICALIGILFIGFFVFITSVGGPKDKVLSEAMFCGNSVDVKLRGTTLGGEAPWFYYLTITDTSGNQKKIVSDTSIASSINLPLSKNTRMQIVDVETSNELKNTVHQPLTIFFDPTEVTPTEFKTMSDCIEENKDQVDQMLLKTPLQELISYRTTSRDPLALSFIVYGTPDSYFAKDN